MEAGTHSRWVSELLGEAVELLGWLELPTDTAPAVIVTSLNEGFVPKSLNSDLFLPNSLRRRLQINDNQRRYARDAYALSVLLASRDEVQLIVGRRDADGNPLFPSRLLFAADEQTIAQAGLVDRQRNFRRLLFKSRWRSRPWSVACAHRCGPAASRAASPVRSASSPAKSAESGRMLVALLLTLNRLRIVARSRQPAHRA